MACCRLVVKIINALSFPVRRVTVCGDSICSIMALRKHGMNYRPFFQNRVGDVTRNLEALGKMVSEVEPLQRSRVASTLLICALGVLSRRSRLMPVVSGSWGQAS